MPTALITGGSRGIGAAMVETYKAAGYQVLTCASSEDSLEDSKADFKFVCDVSDRAQVYAAVENIKQKFSAIDVLVCNAAICKISPFDSEEADNVWTETIGVNLNGSYYFAKACAPVLKEKSGRIIFMGSLSSFNGSPRVPAYSVSKHALIGLTKSFASFLAPRGITVNAICPGWVDTDMTTQYKEQSGFQNDCILSTVAIGRLIDPREIAQLALYLSSSVAAAITGQALRVDGGFLL